MLLQSYDMPVEQLTLSLILLCQQVFAKTQSAEGLVHTVFELLSF